MLPNTKELIESTLNQPSTERSMERVNPSRIGYSKALSNESQ